MLTEQEIMNNALKEMLYREENTAKKFAELAQHTTDPNLKPIIQGMEQAARNNFNAISQMMGTMGIV